MPFDWATESPYEGETVTYIETYRDYQIWYLSGPGVYGLIDPYGTELESFAGSVSGAHTLIDNLLGATYTLTVTCNLDTEILVGEQTVPTNSNISGLNGCYVIEAPLQVMVGGVPWSLEYMQNMQTEVQFPGPSIVQCLLNGPETTHIEYTSAEPTRATAITIEADRTSISEGESVVFTGMLRLIDTGEALPGLPVMLRVDGVDAQAVTTGAGGVFQSTILFSSSGVYIVAAVFEGAETLSPSAAETQVVAGGEGGGVSPLLLAAGIGAATLLLRKR